MMLERNKKINLLACATIGTILEWYDFFLFGTFSSIISAKYFSYSSVPSIISTFGVLAVGFIARPFGALIWGHLGDTLGRKKALLYIMIIMAISTIGIGCLPSYEIIGIYAPILLIVFRILQGMSVSGEHTGSLLLLDECIRNVKNDFYLSCCLASVYVGMLLANLVAFFFSYSLGEKIFHEWGWRIPFILSIILAVLTCYIRKKIEETTTFKEVINKNEIKKVPLIFLFRNNWPSIIVGIFTFQLATAIPYVIFVFLPAYNKSNFIFLSNSINLFIVSILTPFFGLISNSKNRNRIMLLSATLVALISLPLLRDIKHVDALSLLLTQLCFSIVCSAYVGSIGAYLVKLFQVSVRYTGVAICLNIGSMLFGGSVPFFLSILTYQNNNINYAGYFLLISSLITISTLFLTRYRYDDVAYRKGYDELGAN